MKKCTKTIFNLNDSLNQGIKAKVVGPLLKYNGFNQGLIYFFRIGPGTSIAPRRGAKILKKRKKIPAVVV